jgi:putative ABC transport system permease protein
VTRLRLRKMLRDAYAIRGRMVMMVVAIAVSVAAVGAFLSARAILGREIGRNYLATAPASATLDFPGGVGPDAVTVARADPDVLDAAARTSLVARVRVGDGSWHPLVLFVSTPDDPRRIATVAAPPGSWPPPPGGLLLERTALPFLGVRAGDTVTVQAPDGQPVTMTVTAGVHDGGVAPAEQEQTAYGYATTDALTRLGVPSTLDQLKLLVRGKDGTASGDPRQINAVAQRVAAILATKGATVARIEIPPPLRHPHQGQMVMVGFVLLAFGLMSLLLSSVLVATMLRGMLAAQIRQIGAMKAVGARTGQILWMYLSLTTAVAAVATALALAPGLLLGRVLASSGAALLNLDLDSRAVPGWVYAVVLGAGIAVPIGVALPQLLRGSRITVRQALDDHGGATAGTSPIERRLARLRGPDRAHLMALRNLLRRRGRLVLTVGLLAIAGGMFLTGLNAAGGWESLVQQGIGHRHDDLEVRLSRPQVGADLTALVNRVDGVAGSEAWGRAPVSRHTPGSVDVMSVYPDDSHGSFTMLAPPPGTPLLQLPVTAGRWLRPGDTDAVVLNNLASAQLPGVRVGDSVALTVHGRPRTWHVVGVVSDFGTQGAAYVSDDAYAAATGEPGMAELLRIVTTSHDPAARQAVLRRVESALAAAGIGIEQDFALDTLRTGLDGHVLVLADALIAMALVMGFVGLLGLASAMASGVAERTREFAVLHVIGATPAAVRAIVVAEGVATGVLSLVVAGALSLPLTRILGDFIGGQAFRQPLPYHLSGAAAVLWSLLAVSGAAFASMAAARRASRLSVHTALTTL